MTQTPEAKSLTQDDDRAERIRAIRQSSSYRQAHNDPDFLGREDDVGLEFFPGMSLGVDHKLAVVDEILASLSDRYAVVPMREHARYISQRARDGLPVLVVGA